MKKIYLLGVALVFIMCANAQSVIEGDNTNPLLFEDVVKQYIKEHPLNTGVTEVGKYVEENESHQFQRWYWYWKHHTDQDGYMVSSAQNYLVDAEMRRSKGKTTADQSDWKFMGPDTSYGGYSGIGRINCIEFHPTIATTYWVGSAGGGAWKTTNDGVTWTSTTQNLAVLGVSDIDINPKNPNVMYLCPGDRDGSDTYSIGVLKSTDGGNSWNTTGLTWTPSQFRLTNCLVINPIDTSSLTLAASNGIYKSYDGGATWTNVQSGHFKQVIYKPGDTSVLYAPRNNNDREIYRSTNGGKNWSVVTNFNNARRIQLAVTPANPNIVKAIVCNSSNGLMGIYNSTNSGASFSQVYAPQSNCDGNLISGSYSKSKNLATGCGKQGWYDLTIAISPTNANHVIVGGVNAYYSTNGGSSWTLANQWHGGLGPAMTVHADKHMQAYHPTTGALYECNDGGVYKTFNPLSQLWVDLTPGMGITQFYRNAVSSVATYALAGAQDNGTKGLLGGEWDDLTGGDGMNCEMDPIDTNVFYTAIQNGELRRTTNGGGNYKDIQNTISGKPKGAWITPYLISPDNNQHLIAGYKHIYFSSDRGDSWMSIQGSEVRNANCSRLAMKGSPNPVVYATYGSHTNVYYTTNFVAGNTTTFDTLSVPFSGTISDIQVHPTDSAHFWLTYSGYNSPQVVEYDKGTWTQIKGGLPNVPVRCFFLDTSKSVMYVGTDIGVYYRDTSTNNMWASFRKNMPSVEVTDLGVNYTTQQIWASTYGRGLWMSRTQGSFVPPPDTTDTTNSVAIIPYADDVFVVAPNPNNGQFVIKAGDNIELGKVIKLNVIDYAGRVVHSSLTTFNASKQTQVRLNNMPSGMYIVELRDKNVVLGRKQVIVQ